MMYSVLSPTNPTFSLRSPTKVAPSVELRGGGLSASDRYSTMSKTLLMLVPLALVSPLRYLQDEKKERNALFMRDFGGTLSATAFYFTVVEVLKRLNQQALGLKGKELLFFSHIPAQALTLTLAAFWGPALSEWIVGKVVKKKAQNTPPPAPMAPIAQVGGGMAALVSWCCLALPVLRFTKAPPQEAKGFFYWAENRIPVALTSLLFSGFVGFMTAKQLNKRGASTAQTTPPLSQPTAAEARYA